MIFKIPYLTRGSNVFNKCQKQGLNVAVLEYRMITDIFVQILDKTSAEACEKVVGGFGKKNCVSTGVRKPGNTCASPTSMI